MGQAFEAVQVTERLYWVGAIDWELAEFHGYATGRGTTYNAYLLVGDQITLFDTVKAPFRDEMMARIGSVIDPGKIDYLISNHSEMDHSGALPETIRAVRPRKVFASTNGVKALEAHFHLGGGIEAVADGQTLSLGATDVVFAETRMLHWPDSMVSYLPAEKVLVSQDAFGMHLATRHLFADEIPEAVLYYEAAKYYANIVLPFSPIVLKALQKIQGLGWAFDVIAPDHGPIYRRDPGWIVGLYARWAAQKPTRKAVVVYDTMWHSDTRMAEAVAEGLVEGGARPVKVLAMGASHRSDVATEVLEAGALVVGSPTINNTLFPTMADVLCYLEGLKPRNLVGAAFGSYGWSGEAVKRLEEWLRRVGADVVAEGVKGRYVPTGEDLARCRRMGTLVAQRLGETGGDE